MRCRRFCALAAISVLLFASNLIAQRAEIAPRITAPVNETSLVSFTGNVPLLARPEFDRGEAAPSILMSHVRLVLARSSDQQAALDKYDAELQDQSSPNYHKWLTPEEFNEQLALCQIPLEPLERHTTPELFEPKALAKN